MKYWAYVIHGCVFLVAVVLVVGCASSKPQRLQGGELYYNEGMEDLKNGRCLQAVEKLQRVVNNFPGSRFAPDAQYHLAEAHFCSKDYVNAVFEYQRLIDTYPSSEWVDEAEYQIAEAYFRQSRRAELDQSETRNALSHFRTFLDDNPNSPLAEKARQRIAECRDKLARKQFLAARLYQRQGYLEAARRYYKGVLTDYPETTSYYRALFQLAEIALKQGDKETARQNWAEVARDSGDADLQKKAGEKLSEEFKAETK